MALSPRRRPHPIAPRAVTAVAWWAVLSAVLSINGLVLVGTVDGSVTRIPSHDPADRAAAAPPRQVLDPFRNRRQRLGRARAWRCTQLCWRAAPGRSCRCHSNLVWCSRLQPCTAVVCAGAAGARTQPGLSVAAWCRRCPFAAAPRRCGATALVPASAPGKPHPPDHRSLCSQ